MFQKALSFGRDYVVGLAIVLGPMLFALLAFMGGALVVYGVTVILAYIYVYPEIAPAVVAAGLILSIGWAVMIIGSKVIANCLYVLPRAVVELFQLLQKRRKEHTEVA